MKVGIIGSGGREHSICQSLKLSKNVSKLYCFPGNAGTSLIAENINIDLDNFENLKNFIIENKIEIVVIGPEKPLVKGLTDYLENFSIKVFGPNKIASQLEGSKIFTKNLCKKFNIPTANFGIYNSPSKAVDFLNNCNFPIVVKADGLAAGKGVYICENYDQSKLAIKEIFGGKFGEAKNILIEEFLRGEEMSFFVISDGKTFKHFGTAQDHKRVFEGDKGKNTGGMGAYSPSRLENDDLNEKIINKIINPTFEGLKHYKTSFKGFLYAGLMIVKNEPFLIEYNVRMGDPECQTILPKLKSDFFNIIQACTSENLESTKIDWYDDKCLSIVLCSNGYPDKFNNFVEIKNLSKINLNENEYIYHAGTILKNENLFSNGGRVLNFVVRSKDFEQSRNQALKLIKKLNWENGFYRKDIGFKVIDK
tara:strand:+ start:10561 stop:11826 length:1266 start_codon:yes stop_codon:yes gene_type:complete